MHYADGTPASIGDVVHAPIKEGMFGNEVIGILVHGTPAAGTCNAQLQVVARRVVSPHGKSAWQPFTLQYDQCVTIGECNKISV